MEAVAIACHPISARSRGRCIPGTSSLLVPVRLRFPLMNRLLQLAYRYRNRVLEKRYVGIICGGHRDAAGTRSSKSRQAAVSCVDTADTVRRAATATFAIVEARPRCADVEHFLAQAFVHRGYHAAAGGRPVVIAISPLLAFAKDVDTRAELDGTAPFPRKNKQAGGGLVAGHRVLPAGREPVSGLGALWPARRVVIRMFWRRSVVNIQVSSRTWRIGVQRIPQWRRAVCVCLTWVLVFAGVRADNLPRFREHVISQYLKLGYQLVAVDLTGDGKKDLITIDERATELAWFENPSWERHVLAIDVPRQLNAACCDIDGDGCPEVYLGLSLRNSPGAKRRKRGVARAAARGRAIPALAVRGDRPSADRSPRALDRSEWRWQEGASRLGSMVGQRSPAAGRRPGADLFLPARPVATRVAFQRTSWRPGPATHPVNWDDGPAAAAVGRELRRIAPDRID